MGALTPPIDRVGPSLVWFEDALESEERRGSEDTLFLQLTKYEYTLMTLGLFLVGRFYDDTATEDLRSKLHDLVKAQEFCDCPTCEAEREREREEETA